MPFPSLSCKVSLSRFRTWCGEVMTIRMPYWVVLWPTLRCIAHLEWSYVTPWWWMFISTSLTAVLFQLRYSYGVKLLSRADTILIQPEGNEDERTPLLEENAILTSPPSCSTLASDIESDPLKSHTPPPHLNHSRFYNSFPNSPNDSRPNLLSETEDEGEISLATQTRSKHCLYHPWRLIVRTASVLNNFMTVPLWSALASLLVACIQPLKHALMNHLQPLNNSISTAGKCSVPLTLVVLGAYFHTPNQTRAPSRTLMQSMRHFFSHKEETRLDSQENRPRPGETKTIILAVTSRMIITPILLIPALAFASWNGWHELFQE